jgi:hypothetical protein
VTDPRSDRERLASAYAEVRELTDHLLPVITEALEAAVTRVTGRPPQREPGTLLPFPPPKG